jgi:hypothetical protein
LFLRQGSVRVGSVEQGRACCRMINNVSTAIGDLYTTLHD